MKIPITQTTAWQKLQDDLGEKSFYVNEPDYSYLAILKHTPTGNYLYCPYGPCYKTKRTFAKVYELLKKLAKEQKAIFIRVEPQDHTFPVYKPRNTYKSRDLNPKETWLLDLTGTDEELKNRLPSRLLRYYRGAEKKGITIEKTNNPDDIKHLVKLQSALATEKGINTFSEHYLKTELQQPFATLYLVFQNEKEDQSTDGLPSLGAPHRAQPRDGGRCEDRTRRRLLASGLVFDDDDTRYNLQGAQSDEGRKLHATGILTIQLIIDAKEKGLKTFDFWGIAPEGANPNHPWAGFTAFKKTFAGYEQNYAGTYDLVLSPTKYKLYKSSRKLNRILRRHRQK